MLSNGQKYLLAGAVSLAGCGLSVLWYQNAKQAFMRGDDGGEKLAVLQSGKGEVERKPGQRLIWQPLAAGSALVNGDTIRTGSRGEGRVNLLESGTVIALEPDSLIVIERSKGSISLDLLSGGLFIKSESKTATAASPTIKAGNTTLSLGKAGAEMSLSLDQGKNATLAVSKGNIDVSAANGKQVTLSQGASSAITDKGVTEQKVIQVIEPAPNAVIDIGATGKDPVSFTWTPMSDNMTVFLELGSSRTDLKRWPTPGAPLSAGRLVSAISAGSFYWRLVATDGKPGTTPISSLVYRASTVSLMPPTLVAPKSGEAFYLTKKAIEIPVSWSTPEHAEKVMIAVAKSKDFKEIVYHKSFESGSDDTIDFNASGTYYWRAFAYFSGKPKPVGSETGSFVIQDRLDLKAPELVQPANSSMIPLAKAKQGGLFLEWSDVPGSEAYEVKITAKKSGKTQTEKTSVSQIRFDQIQPGVVNWQVRAVGPASQTSKWSPVFSFKISEIGNLSWIIPSEDSFEYKTQKPSIPLAWERGPELAAKWRLRYGKTKDDLVTREWVPVAGTKTTIELPSDGKFLFEVQALDKDDTLLAIAKSRQILVGPPPPLDPPDFLEFETKTKSANPDGSFRLRWKKIADAKSYLVTVKEPGGKGEKKYQEKTTALNLSGLQPGKYQVQVATIDERGEIGDLSEPRFIDVPKISNIQAPKVNSIKVH